MTSPERRDLSGAFTFLVVMPGWVILGDVGLTSAGASDQEAWIPGIATVPHPTPPDPPTLCELPSLPTTEQGHFWIHLLIYTLIGKGELKELPEVPVLEIFLDANLLAVWKHILL